VFNQGVFGGILPSEIPPHQNIGGHNLEMFTMCQIAGMSATDCKLNSSTWQMVVLPISVEGWHQRSHFKVRRPTPTLPRPSSDGRGYPTPHRRCSPLFQKSPKFNVSWINTDYTRDINWRKKLVPWTTPVSILYHFRILIIEHLVGCQYAARPGISLPFIYEKCKANHSANKSGKIRQNWRLEGRIRRLVETRRE